MVYLQRVLPQVLHIEYAAHCSITTATMALFGNFVILQQTAKEFGGVSGYQ